jgi:hypothetical protein
MMNFVVVRVPAGGDTGLFGENLFVSTAIKNMLGKTEGQKLGLSIAVGNVLIWRCGESKKPTSTKER